MGLVTFYQQVFYKASSKVRIDVTANLRLRVEFRNLYQGSVLGADLGGTPGMCPPIFAETGCLTVWALRCRHFSS